MYTTQSFTRFIVCLVTVATVVTASVRVGEANTSNDNDNDKEKTLIAVLRSDAPSAEKAIACKNLAIDGSSEAVPELAKLLSDPQLSSWARIALEVIPGEDADKALRDAADALDGTLLVGMINSIGVRRDAKAVDSLATHLENEDAEAASAAAVALGRIGNDAATRALRQALATAPANVRSAVAEGCVLCAERLYAAGSLESATEIYDAIRSAEVPKQRVIEATRGAILARGQEGIPLLMETFRSTDKKMFQLALGTAREFPGGEVDRALVKELSSASSDRAALIVQAMADRPDTVVLEAVLNFASQGDKQVRLSAIDALRRVGNDSCLSALLEIADDVDTDFSTAALETLASLPGESVNKQIVAMLPKSQGKNQTLLLQLVGKRRIDAVDDVFQAVDHSDSAVRHAALVALGETVSLDALPRLVSQAVSAKNSSDADVAQQALRAASVRMPDRDACTRKLVAAMSGATSATKDVLLEIISEVGGTTALETLGDAAKSADPQMQDTSSRLLGKWNGVEAAPVLLDLAKTAPAEKYQIRALRGYIGLARKFAMSNPERAKMCQSALTAASRMDEKRLVLDVMILHPSHATLNLANKVKQDPALKEAATSAAQEITKKLRAKGIVVQ